MFLVVYNIGTIVNPTIIGTFVQVLVGSISYIGIMFIIKDANLLYIINFIKNKIRYKKEMQQLL